jgi:hypothetical protein
MEDVGGPADPIFRAARASKLQHGAYVQCIFWIAASLRWGMAKRSGTSACGLAHRLRSTGILIGDKVDPAPVDVAIVGDRTAGAHRLADDAVGRRRLWLRHDVAGLNRGIGGARVVFFLYGRQATLATTRIADSTRVQTMSLNARCTSSLLAARRDGGRLPFCVFLIERTIAGGDVRPKAAIGRTGVRRSNRIHCGP